MSSIGSDRVKINVGGTEFLTTTTTIANAGRDSMLCSLLLDNDWRLKRHEVFIDRNPDYFSVLLDLLRTNELRVPRGMQLRSLVREAVFYGIENHVKSAAWKSPLDGNRVENHVVASVPGSANDDDLVGIRASPLGGCGVAHGCMVHLYDWLMERLRPINLDFMNVNDFGFLVRNPTRVLVSSMDRGEFGGLGCFNSLTGKLERRFKLPSKRSFLALACASSDSEVFCSCMRGEKGIGIWDQETGNSVGFVGSEVGGSKLQWLPKSELLLVESMFPQSDHCYFSLLDPRMKSRRAWEWSDCEMETELVIRDAVAIENRSMICVVDQYDNLGFIDMRMSSCRLNLNSNPNHAPVQWSQMFQRIKRSEYEEHSYSKLRINSSPSTENLQLFSSREKTVQVYSCSASFLSASTACNSIPRTANLMRPDGGQIADIDIGGDRLFVLHRDEDSFDVWETPILYSNNG